MRKVSFSLLNLLLAASLLLASVQAATGEGEAAEPLPAAPDTSTEAEDDPVRLEAFGLEPRAVVDGVNATGSEGGNETRTGSNSTVTARLQLRRIRCRRKVEDDAEDDAEDNAEEPEPTVRLVDGTELLQLFSESHNPNVTNRSVGAECHLAMFYAPWCRFSALAAPHFNALARLYPDVGLVAVDSSANQGVNTQFGILAVPTLIIFHNTKPIAKFNRTEHVVENFVEFVDAFTFLKPAGEAGVREVDLVGPMPTEAAAGTDYYLGLAWLFTIACAVGYFGKSSLCARIAENVRNNWREVEIQHEHID